MGLELNHVEDLRAAPVVDTEDAESGTIEDIFIDRQTGPRLGRGEHWAPRTAPHPGSAHRGFLNFNGEAQLPLATAQVKDAPSMNLGEEFTPALERRMCEALRAGRL